MFFKELNYKLTQQGRWCGNFRVMVVKFTGAGLMASFRVRQAGPGVRCAVRSWNWIRSTLPAFTLPFGQGLCDGLVGAAGRPRGNTSRADIFGWPVHWQRLRATRPPGPSS